jgi:hypothetical protein|tara:strand:+ start:285 stop:524 length:240 start_codon:yes stop_codon:yes gene_type:complete
MNNINEEGYYTGSEVQWNVEDVEIFAQANDMEFSQEDYKRILNATFEDNEYLMNMIQECIATTIDFMLDEGELKLNNNE